MVFYRKYRPQTIDQLDSEKVKKKLSAVLQKKDTFHAFLFTGPKGLGKTSTARIIAKVINCEKGLLVTGKLEPCGKCDQCISITNGTNVDILEIDGASNRGIDEIRDLREKVRLSPAAAKKKVYIIDEVHMLTTEAFNALLKTIEEPPSHVMFIFCTTEPQKVPSTIVSRCFHINFPMASEDEIVHSLQRIVKGEKLDIKEEVLPMIAQMADGGFRDAAKILEEISLLATEGKITKELFEKSYKTTNIILFVYKFLAFLSERNSTECLKIISEVVQQGTDMKFFLYQILSALHRMLLQQAGVKQEEREYMFPQNLQFSIEQIRQLAELFNRAYQEMKYSVLPQLPLEISIITWCSSGSEITQTYSGKQTLSKESKSVIKKKEEEKQNNEQQEIQSGVSTVSLMENLINKTKPYDHSVAALLRSCKIISFGKKITTIEAGYRFHKERLEEKKTKDVIEEVLKELTGNSVEIKVVLKSKAFSV